MEPASGELVNNCENEIKVILDTQKQNINTVDLKIIKGDFNILGVDRQGAIFKNYSQPKLTKVRNGNNKGKQATYIMGTTSSDNGFIGSGTFIKLKIKPTKTGNILVDFYVIDGKNSDDTNAIYYQNGETYDSLTKIIGGKYKSVNGTCKTNIKTGAKMTNTNYAITVGDLEKIMKTLMVTNTGSKTTTPITQENNRTGAINRVSPKISTTLDTSSNITEESRFNLLLERIRKLFSNIL